VFYQVERYNAAPQPVQHQRGSAPSSWWTTASVPWTTCQPRDPML
jgi:hypothetical protein